MRVSSSAEEMCTHGGMEPGTCGSRSSASSSAMAAEERRIPLPEEAGEEGTVLKCLVASLLEVLPRLLPSQRARELHAESGWFAGGDHLLNDVGPVRRAA
jgi:hypothetical protein